MLGPLLFDFFINDLCNLIKFSYYLPSAEDVNNFRAIKTPHDCSLHQMYINCIHCWRIQNYMKINVSKSGNFSLLGKITIHFQYKLCGSRVNHADIVKNPRNILDVQLYFHPHVDYVYMSTSSQAGGCYLCYNFLFSSTYRYIRGLFRISAI